MILARIEDQGKLTDELKDRILACFDKSGLEDLYSPFKRKESKEASAAREEGLEPLAKKAVGAGTRGILRRHRRRRAPLGREGRGHQGRGH